MAERVAACTMMLGAAILLLHAFFDQHGIIAQLEDTADHMRHEEYDQGTLPPDDVQFAKDLYAHIARPDSDVVTQNTAPATRNFTAQSRQETPPPGFCIEAIGHLEVTGGREIVQKAVVYGIDRTVISIGLQSFCSGHWYLWIFEFIREQDGSRQLTTGNTILQQMPLQEINAFSLTSRRPEATTLLTAMAVTVLFVVYTLIKCIRSQRGVRRIVWSIFIILTVTPASFDWRNGFWDIEQTKLAPFGIAWEKYSPYSHTFLFLGIPLGAISFLLSSDNGRTATDSQVQL
jgi:hypothetical protein